MHKVISNKRAARIVFAANKRGDERTVSAVQRDVERGRARASKRASIAA